MDKSIRHFNLGRSCLLAIAAFGAINTALALLGQNMYFLFSNFLAYASADFCRYGYETTGNGTLLVIGAVIAVVVLGLFLLCWLLSKKHPGWLIVGLVLMVLDTLVVIYCALTLSDNPAELALDFVFHVIMVVELVLGVIAAKKVAAQMKPQEAAEPWEQQPEKLPASEQTDAPPRENTPCMGEPAEKARVLVEADFGARHIQVLRSRGLTELVVDGRVYGRREGIVETAYTISAVVHGHEIATTLTPDGRQRILADGEILAEASRTS
ncbi:MAG: hypothetical protein II458_05640 [Oscillospiraceae bacterium]|nr:hypothetical protein [Oscillospiraceae bacterium]